MHRPRRTQPSIDRAFVSGLQLQNQATALRTGRVVIVEQGLPETPDSRAERFSREGRQYREMDQLAARFRRVRWRSLLDLGVRDRLPE